MVISERKLVSFLRQNWFFPALVLVVCTDVFIGRLEDWSNARALEIGVLLDLAVFIPLFYLWCYRAKGRPAIIRAVGLSCFGIWVAGFIIPVEHQLVLNKLEFIRYVLLALIFVSGARLMFKVYSVVLGDDKDARSSTMKAAKRQGTPQWLLRIWEWEATTWKKFVDFIRSIIGWR